MRKTQNLTAVALAALSIAGTCYAQEAYTLSCPGTITTDTTTGAPDCTNGTGTVVAWQVVPPFDVSQLDYGEAGQAFAAGFVLVGMCWGLGMAVGAIMRTIRR